MSRTVPAPAKEQRIDSNDQPVEPARGEQQHDAATRTVAQSAAPRTSTRIATMLDRVVAPMALFVCLYLAAFIALFWARLLPVQWTAAVSVTIATALTVAMWDRGRWRLGLLAPPLTALRELGGGVLFACILIAAADLLIVATTDVHHRRGNGFPWTELLLVFIPAVLHEELLFRGYAYQKLRVWNRGVAILLSAAIFMVLHMRNAAVTPLALANIFLGGVLLALAYERYESLLFPIGLHLAWNLASGPVLGYQVSGYVSAASLLVTDGAGRPMLTGGAFGIEGSIFMTAMECAAIAALWSSNRRMTLRRQNSAPAAGVPHLNS